MTPGHLVRGRIDDVVDVSGVVALEDPDRDPFVGVEARHSLAGYLCCQKNDAEEGGQRSNQT